MMLYKYVGHEDTSKLIEILKFFIEDGTIRATSPHYFNDPAELKVQFDFNATKEEKEARFYEMWADKNDESCANWLRNRDLHTEQYDAYMLRGNLLHSTGVICLTKDYNNFLMWSHYARAHSGFCIGFDDTIVNALDDSNTIAQGEVEYSDNLPVVNFYTSDIHDIIKALFMYKGTVWKYEEEFRVISQTSGIKTFNKSLVREVIIGCRPHPNLEIYMQTLANSELAIFKMSCPPGSYHLERKPF